MQHVRLGYFTEAQPFQVACARGWLDLPGYAVACLPQSSGSYAANKLDDGDLHMSVLGSTPYAVALARGINISAVYTVHSKGDSQGLVMRSMTLPHQLTPSMMLAVPKGSTAHYHLLFLIESFSVQPKVVFMPPSRIVTAWDAGTIDGAFCWGGAYAHMRRTGHLMLTARQLGWWGKETFNVLAAQRSFSEAHPTIVRHIVSVFSALDAEFTLRADNLWTDERFTESVTDAIASNASSAAAIVTVDAFLRDFLFLSRDEQLSCAYLRCTTNRSGLAVATQLTSRYA